MQLVPTSLDDEKNFNIYLKSIEKSFPKEERTDALTYAKFLEHGGQPYFIVSKGQVVGVCYAFENASMAYIYYLAINENLRNNGLGSCAIKTLKEHFFDKPLVLSIEEIDNNNIDTLRRYKFYKKNNFEKRNLSYTWQGVRLELMTDSIIDVNEYKDTFGKLFDYTNYKS